MDAATHMAVARGKVAIAQAQLAKAEAELAAAKAKLGVANSEEDKKKAEEDYAGTLESRRIAASDVAAAQAFVKILIATAVAGVALLSHEERVVHDILPRFFGSRLLLENDQQQDLKPYEVVMVENKQPDFRVDRYIVTEQVAELVEKFFKNFHADRYSKWFELCISGAPGCGKSCAVQILVGEIRRRIPNSLVVFSHSKEHRPNHNERNLVRTHGRKTGMPVFLVIDQFEPADVDELSRIADLEFYVILVSSSHDLSYFRKTSIGYPKNHHQFAMTTSIQSCNAVLALLSSTGISPTGAPPKPTVISSTTTLTPLPLPFESQRMCLPKTLDEVYQWSSGHLLTIVKWWKGMSPERLLMFYENLIQDVFAKSPDKARLVYLELVYLFDIPKFCRLTFCHEDSRFIDEQGQLLSVMFMQAYLSHLVFGRPPQYSHSCDYPPYPEGKLRVVRKECVQDDLLWDCAPQCLQELGLKWNQQRTFPFHERMAFATLADVEAKLAEKENEGERERKAGDSFSLYCIPIVKQEQDDLDCILIFHANNNKDNNNNNNNNNNNSRTFVIVNYVTMETARKYLKSSRWRHTVKELRKMELLKQASFVVLLTCQTLKVDNRPPLTQDWLTEYNNSNNDSSNTNKLCVVMDTLWGAC